MNFEARFEQTRRAWFHYERITGDFAIEGVHPKVKFTITNTKDGNIIVNHTYFRHTSTWRCHHARVVIRPDGHVYGDIYALNYKGDDTSLICLLLRVVFDAVAGLLPAAPAAMVSAHLESHPDILKRPLVAVNTHGASLEDVATVVDTWAEYIVTHANRRILFEHFQAAAIFSYRSDTWGQLDTDQLSRLRVTAIDPYK